MFYKKSIYVLIIQVHNYNTPPTNSNDRGHLNNQESSTAEKKGFQMPQLSFYTRIRATYSISMKYDQNRQFKTIFTQFG